MSSFKRPFEAESPKTPTVLGASASKKRCITDFFSPRLKTEDSNESIPMVPPTSKPKSPVSELKDSVVNNSTNTPGKKISSPNVSKENSPFVSRLQSTPNRTIQSTPNKTCRTLSVSNDTTPSHRNENNTKAPESEEQHLHLSYKFLFPPHRRDIEKRSPEHPDYDENTLYVPENFLNSQTPALRQWWLIKQRHMDAILFFKMGKFYELFNEDAVIGVNHLDICYMKGDESKPAHAGFPEVSYEKYSKKLIEKGFKVIRIEQTETPAMMEDRCQVTGQKGKFDRVVKREVCRITTKGTQMLGVMESVFHSPQNQYLLALHESNADSLDGDRQPAKVFGVCFVDVTISKVYIGQFIDDHNYSKINILLSHHKPTEVIYERGNICRETQQALLRTGALLTMLKPTKEFWPIKKALVYLRTHNIFQDESGKFEWPSVLRELFDGDSSENLINMEANPNYAEALESFAALVYYLQSQLIADQVLKCTNFELYQSVDTSCTIDHGSSSRAKVSSMILDHIALKNLEVFENSQGGTTSTLFESINYCKTHFGQRLLKSFLCSPLCDIDQINNRLDAVGALMSNNNASLMNEISHVLGQTPDLERLLSKVKVQCFKSESDSRAIMFDGDHHSKAKISSFLNLLQNFKRLRKFIISVKKCALNCDSSVLKRLLTLTIDGGLFPDYEDTLDYFDSCFNHDIARKTGKIIPAPGVDANYDRCKVAIDEINDKLNDYLDEQRVAFNCRQIEYFGSAKNRFQIQVPEAYCKKVPPEYRIETTRKGYKRYYTPVIDKLFQKLTVNEEEIKKTLENIMSKIFAQFASKVKLWSAAIECMAILDVLQSLASFARSLMARNIDICRPEIISSDQPIINYTDGRHPALVKANPDFTANDLTLDDRLILLTGANMGGKSTLMRQTALLVILAQIGSYVPVSRIQLSPVDRIFSRLGASDRLIEGESTFYTELVETSSMLRHASKNSLLLLDELGRGTSTYDGTAIAFSVIKEISTNIRSRCLFSTHYHSLVRDFKDSKTVRLAHMGCKVEKNSEKDIDSDPLKESITFLYKVTEGPVARSYGFNVARLAGIEDSIIMDAYEKAKEFELRSKMVEIMRDVCEKSEPSLEKTELKERVIAAIA